MSEEALEQLRAYFNKRKTTICMPEWQTLLDFVQSSSPNMFLLINTDNEYLKALQPIFAYQVLDIASQIQDWKDDGKPIQRPVFSGAKIPFKTSSTIASTVS